MFRKSLVAALAAAALLAPAGFAQADGPAGHLGSNGRSMQGISQQGPRQQALNAAGTAGGTTLLAIEIPAARR